MQAGVELLDQRRVARHEREREVARLEDGGGRKVDLLARLGVELLGDVVDVDRRQLDTVDHEHAGVAGLEVDEHAALAQHLDRLRVRLDALDRGRAAWRDPRR